MSCQYCGGKGPRCNEIVTYDSQITDNGKPCMRSEIYQCTRPRGHVGGCIACWDAPDPKDASKTVHCSKAWTPRTPPPK